MQENIFKKYRSRLTLEATLKAFLIGASVGFGVAFLVGLLSWFFAFKAGLWVALGLFVVITGVLTAVLYAVKFRPTTKAVASRVDELGLEERVITMTELEGEDSYIAHVQREDTVKALGTVNHSLIKLAVTASMIIAVVVSGVLFAGSVTVGGLYAADVIPSGISLLMGEEQVAKYSVNYSVARGTEGQIVYYTDDWDNGQNFDAELFLYEGEDAPAVIAVPADGWVFVSWSDGLGDPYRHDMKVGGSIDLVATFMRGSFLADEDKEPESDDISIPTNDINGPPKPDDNDYERLKPGNQIENGNTYYGDGYDDAYNESMDKMNSNDNISDEMKGHIGDYFDALNPRSDADGNNPGMPDDEFLDEYYGAIGGDQGGSNEGSEENEG